MIARPPAKSRAILRRFAPVLLLPLGACNWVVMAPSGDVAMQQRDLILIATALMLLIVVPVMGTIAWFAWKYRAKAQAADYDPDWDHSTSLELLIWSAPLLIIIALGAVTWTSTHLLDPYRPVERLDPQRKVDPAAKRLQVEVVALDWKWLFIYPELGIATVNELAAPIDQPIEFKITSASIMNSFFVPALAGQIYAMPAMQTSLHAVANRPGTFDGFSANYSGAGFSNMRFKFHAMDQRGFDQWVARVKASGQRLDRATYVKLEQPSEKVKPIYFASVEPRLFHAALNMCVQPGKRCMDQIMMTDALGGAGKESARDTAGLRHDGTIDVGGYHPVEPGKKGEIAQPAGMTPAAERTPAERGNQAPGQQDHEGHGGGHGM
ncbi:cytochrome ubiquinol oxidase subunit II [Sphingobium sp. GW456-12-10-14-TSB1]|uniref:Ubiquinol oxidase polypeptide II n=1 Tax=Sphingobium xenophagum TaxID=121428 RepID=A0A249MPR7_SPHXE|nr:MULTISPECIES: ubiquinol oxidase subunit II [Sphingobium]ASY43149.1 cytochrome ubiquinol oxidase subunit II [Sphingobium xenophagum]MDZ7894718.1 ubiquinol oxidase subunit II [Sphingobium sp.]OUC55154.1 cytochrome ubiquinol oxidase subunit II [Sphingobium sp. GW456-12-10-14-TSB1]QWT13695.1 ubiquinol oxidase subunit II [Sphingobium xenophagum]|tara:strand:+ start:4513 stop:5652 length:1140 start_codon:yes stop_codon:yes gene_type:complete